MPNAVAEGLARHGFDVTPSGEAALLSASDEMQLAFALGEGRVLITRDRDFLRLHAAGHQHAGVVVWTERQRSVGQLIRSLDALSIDQTAEALRGTVTYL